MLDFDLLKCFVAVAEHGGFTVAGSHIGLTQSAVSQRIRRLEERLEKPLFIRTTRALELSPDGEMLLGYAKRILALQDEALDRLRAPRMRGALRVGFVDYFGPAVLPETIRRFARAYPDVHLELHAGMGMELRPLYESGQLDLLIAGDDGSGEGLQIGRDRLVWACHGEYETESLTAPGSWQATRVNRPDAYVPLISLPQPCAFRAAAIRTLEEQGRKWEVVFTGTGMASVLAAVRAGLGVTVLPRGAVTSEFRLLADDAGFPLLPDFSTYLYANANVAEALRISFASMLEQQLGIGAA